MSTMDEESGLLDGQIESQYIDAKVFPPIFTEPVSIQCKHFQNKKTRISKHVHIVHINLAILFNYFLKLFFKDLEAYFELFQEQKGHLRRSFGNSGTGHIISPRKG